MSKVVTWSDLGIPRFTKRSLYSSGGGGIEMRIEKQIRRTLEIKTNQRNIASVYKAINNKVLAMVGWSITLSTNGL